MLASDTNDDNIADAAARPTRMDAVATLPVFFKLKGKRAVLAGASEPALWKAELLAAAGARVDVYAEAFAAGFDVLVTAPPGGSVTLHRRVWHRDDLKGAAIAVGAVTNDVDAQAFAMAARAAGVPVNVIDRPDFCDFQFGAIVNRSPLVVAVSTDGAAPVFGQTIRSLIEGLLPDGLKRWAAAAKSWRRDADRFASTAAAKRRFWERFADLALREADRPPADDDLDRLVAETASGGLDAAQSSITIITIETDDVETLTLGAVRALRNADRIFYTAGVPVAVLTFARREALRSLVGRPASEATPAPDLVEEAAAAATDGRRVVWLTHVRETEADVAAFEADALAARLLAAGLAFVRIGSSGSD